MGTHVRIFSNNLLTVKSNSLLLWQQIHDVRISQFPYRLWLPFNSCVVFYILTDQLTGLCSSVVRALHQNRRAAGSNPVVYSCIFRNYSQLILKIVYKCSFNYDHKKIHSVLAHTKDVTLLPYLNRKATQEAIFF